MSKAFEPGWGEYEGYCRGPVFGECGRKITAKLPVTNGMAEHRDRHVVCAVCGTTNSIGKKNTQ